MPRGTVVLHVSRPPSFLDRHEGQTICSVARSIARLKDFDYAGPHDRVRLDAGSLFFVPDDTLLRRDADALGIREVKDLYGGIVPFPFVQTKAVSHGLIDPAAARPEGWSLAFAERIEDVVLPGFTAFTRDEARRALSAGAGHDPREAAARRRRQRPAHACVGARGRRAARAARR